MQKYTFLLPAYKAKYFETALNSLKQQNFKDFKVIVSDDCSPENLKSIFDSTVGRDNRFTYRCNEINVGSKSLVAHWNMLVDMCETEYLIMASDDDVYAPNFLEEINELTKKYPNVDLFRGRVNRIDSNGETTEEDNVDIQNCKQVDFLFNLFCRYRIKCVGNYVWKTSALKEIGRFKDFPLAWGSDDIAVMEMSRNGVCITSSPVFSFRCSGDNISNKNSRSIRVRKVEAKLQNLLYVEKFVSSIESDGSLLQNKRLQSFANSYISECEMQLMQNSCVLPFKKMWQNFRFLVKRGYMPYTLERLQFIWIWLRNR